MHTYTIESSERRSIPFAMALLALGATLLVRKVAAWLGLEPSAVVYLPSAFAIYGAIYFAFDRFIWRWKLLRTLGLVKAVPIDGNWRAQLRSSHSDMDKVHEARLQINQTWTAIRLTLDGSRSFSISRMASMENLSPRQLEIRWEYSAESKDPSTDQDFNHRGVTMLRVEVSRDRIENEVVGHYYTQLGRDTHGSIMATREAT